MNLRDIGFLSRRRYQEAGDHRYLFCDADGDRMAKLCIFGPVRSAIGRSMPRAETMHRCIRARATPPQFFRSGGYLRHFR
jgi:hypothetical protein